MTPTLYLNRQYELAEKITREFHLLDGFDEELPLLSGSVEVAVKPQDLEKCKLALKILGWNVVVLAGSYGGPDRIVRISLNKK